MAKVTKEDANYSLEFLRERLNPKDKIYCLLRHTSSSGMSRSIDLFFVKDNELWNISRHVSNVLGRSLDHKNGGIKEVGCGMDMGFHLVYCLGLRLWPNGTPEPHGIRNGEPDSNGGYALIHHWI